MAMSARVVKELIERLVEHAIETAVLAHAPTLGAATIESVLTNRHEEFYLHVDGKMYHVAVKECEPSEEEK